MSDDHFSEFKIKESHMQVRLADVHFCSESASMAKAMLHSEVPRGWRRGGLMWPMGCIFRRPRTYTGYSVGRGRWRVSARERPRVADENKRPGKHVDGQRVRKVHEHLKYV